MADIRTVVEDFRLDYEGLFNATELYRIIDQFFRERHYDKREATNQEHLKKDGSKYVEIELLPWKKYTEYLNSVVRIRWKMFDLREVEVKQHGRVVKLNKGRIQMIFTGFISTDYENKWEEGPLYYLVRVVYDKYVHREYREQHHQLLKDIISMLYDQIQAYLNLYKY